MFADCSHEVYRTVHLTMESSYGEHERLGKHYPPEPEA